MSLKRGRPRKIPDEPSLPLPIPQVPAAGRGISALARFSRSGLPKTGPWEPYTKQADAFRKHHCKMLAIQAGGHCGAAPSSMVASAAVQLAVSQYLFDTGAAEDDLQKLKVATMMANDSRANLIAAYEMAVREAQAMKAVAKDGMTPTRMLELAIASEGQEDE